jgi:hypothetical protein
VVVEVAGGKEMLELQVDQVEAVVVLVVAPEPVGKVMPEAQVAAQMAVVDTMAWVAVVVPTELVHHLTVATLVGLAVAEPNG